MQLARNTSFSMEMQGERELLPGRCIQIQKDGNDCIYSYEGCR